MRTDASRYPGTLPTSLAALEPCILCHHLFNRTQTAAVIEHQSVGIIQSLNRQLLLICADKYLGNSCLSFVILALRLLAPRCVSDGNTSSLSLRVVFLE